MASRDEWLFPLTALEVQESTAKRALYHAERTSYWANEIELARDAIQAAGIDIRSYDITGGQRHDVVIDPTLANRLSEAQSKMQRHEHQEAEYDRWHDALDLLADDAILQLKISDIEYFGL